MSDDQFARSWLPRQQRRHIDRALRKLIHRNACSLCGQPFQPGTATAPGFDASGTVALAGECCVDKLTEIWSGICGWSRPMSPAARDPPSQKESARFDPGA